MSRVPADKPLKLRGEAAFWRAICGFGEDTWTLSDVEDCCNAARQTVREYLIRLEKGGYIETVGEAPATSAKLFRRVKTAAEAPRLHADGSPVTAGRGTAQMWRSMKMLKTFDAHELSIAASTEDAMVSVATAADYTKHLHRAGYLALAAPSKPGHRPGTGKQARYRLLPSKNTGPKAPQIQRVKRVFDPNLGKVMWEEDHDA
jgi:hypothetical protein